MSKEEKINVEVKLTPELYTSISADKTAEIARLKSEVEKVSTGIADESGVLEGLKKEKRDLDIQIKKYKKDLSKAKGVKYKLIKEIKKQINLQKSLSLELAEDISVINIQVYYPSRKPKKVVLDSKLFSSISDDIKSELIRLNDKKTETVNEIKELLQILKELTEQRESKQGFISDSKGILGRAKFEKFKLKRELKMQTGLQKRLGNMFKKENSNIDPNSFYPEKKQKKA